MSTMTPLRLLCLLLRINMMPECVSGKALGISDTRLRTSEGRGEAKLKVKPMYFKLLISDDT